MNNPKFVKFEVLKIEDIRKTGSTVAIGKILRGLYYESSNTVFFSDENGQDWTFYVDDIGVGKMMHEQLLTN